MDYEKEYNEALRRAKELHEAGNALTKQQMEIVFPQLAENEDERIRQAIIAVVEWAECFNSSSVTHEAAETMLAYLEKQKELPTNEEMLRTLRAEYEKGVADTIAKYEQKEQKFTEKQDCSDLTDLERAIHRGFLVVGVENVPVTIIKETAQDCLAWMKPQKGANGNEMVIPNKQKPTEYLDKDKVYAIMHKLHELAFSQLIPFNSDEYKKIDEITGDVRKLLNKGGRE